MASSMRPIQPDHNRTDINGMPHIPINTNATPTIFERHTKSGRHLRYKLTILQQPERARACGSGSKSAADRRPVDPPPVVELLIFDVCNGQEKDITFSYNVNFFLFATLEHARPMVHGRVQTPSATSPPVLTGMPVSGMAYLDRPSVAGYFLFPDLSVRHEGRYRLAFNLYEEIKEAGDADLEPAEKSSDVNDNPAFDWRMEIKSNPFTVYSAKKFPGLTESTLLSRTVADQGCRVRIRRDVRMRRRETKGDSGRSSNRERRAVEQRIPRTPDRQPVEQYRARSGSSHSVHSDHGRVPAPMVPSMPHSMPPSMPQSYQSEPKRKISISESYQAPPLPPNHSNSAPSASYNGPSAPYSYASSTPSHHAPPPPPPQSPSHNYPSSYNPPYPSYPGSSRPVSQSYDRHNSVSTSYTPMEVDPKHDRRPSVSHPVTPSPSTHYPSEYEKLDRRPSFAVPPTPSYKDNNNFRLPPLRDLAPTSQVMPDIPPTQPPPASSKYINAHIEPDTEPESPIRLPSLAINSGNKRTRDPSPSDSCRYFNGARQETGTTPSYTPNPYLSSRQDPSYYMHSHPSHPDSLEWMSAEGYSKSLPQNRFY